MKYFKTVNDIFLKSKRENKLKLIIPNHDYNDKIVKFFLLPKNKRENYINLNYKEEKEEFLNINDEISKTNAKVIAKKIIVAPINLLNLAVVSLNTFLLAPAVLSGVGFNFGINASYSDKPAKKTLKVLSLLASGVILAPVLLSASVLMGVSHVLSIPNSKIESTFLDDCLNIYQEHKSKFDSM